MNVLIFGASGMVGGGTLLECLEDDGIASVTCVGRRSVGVTHPKLTEVFHSNLFDLSAVADELTGFDACLYTLGVTSAGMSEEEYRRITVDLTRAILEPVLAANPQITICFVSGQGTDGSEKGRVMWARVKGEAENYVLGLPVRAHVFRPGFIQPLKGVRSRTATYQALYTVIRPLVPLLRAIFPSAITTTVEVGRAMIRVVREQPDDTILEQGRIVELGRLQMTPVPRIGRVLDLIGMLFLLVGGGFVARAWFGFREVQEYVPPPDAQMMAAVEFANGFWRMQKVGVALMLVGIGVFVVAWWIARRAHVRNSGPEAPAA